MLIEDHRLRVSRIMRGERRVDDLDRLFGDLRLVRPGRASVREVGHFAAHRGERDAGVVLERAGYIQVSLGSWYRQLEGRTPSFEEMRAAAEANLAIAPDERVRERLRVSRQAARGLFRKGMARLEAGLMPNLKEREAIRVLGLGGMWQYAFDDARLLEDLGAMLAEEGSLAEDRRDEFEACGAFLGAYALALMHGANLRLPDGLLAPLRLAVRDETGTLRIKAAIPVAATLKPASIEVSLFETSLLASDHLDSAVVVDRGPPRPLEVGAGCRLVAVG